MLRVVILASTIVATGIATLIAESPQKGSDGYEQILKLTEAVEKLTARIEHLEARIASMERDEKPVGTKTVLGAPLGILTTPDMSAIIIDEVSLSGGKVLVRLRVESASDGYFSLASLSEATDDKGDSLECTAVSYPGNRLDFQVSQIKIADVKVRRKNQVKCIIEFALKNDKMQMLRSLTLVGRNVEYGTLKDLPVSAR